MIIDAGDDFDIVNFDLTTSAQDITTTDGFKRAILQGREENQITIRRVGTDASTKTFLLKPGYVLSLPVRRLRAAGATITICDARVASGTEVLEVMLIK